MRSRRANAAAGSIAPMSPTPATARAARVAAPTRNSAFEGMQAQ